jgi:hypothetical protein
MKLNKRNKYLKNFTLIYKINKNDLYYIFFIEY